MVDGSEASFCFAATDRFFVSGMNRAGKVRFVDLGHHAPDDQARLVSRRLQTQELTRLFVPSASRLDLVLGHV